MSSSETQTSLLDLMGIIKRVESGSWVLPEFQRNFVWSDNDIRALLATALSDWPMGSLLLMGGQSDTFVTRPLDGVGSKVEVPEIVILDGQQRITSLFHAFRNKGRKVFAIRWSEKFEELEDPEEIIFHYSKRIWNSRYGTHAKQAAERMLPFYALGSASDFFEWRDRVLEHYSDSGTRSRERENLSNLYGSVLSHLHKYRVPAVILGAELEPQAISRIFERVNKTGIRLSTFDLMVAKTFLPDWNLRDQWRVAREEFPRISRFLRDDGLPVLQTISLKASENLRQSGVLRMTGEIVRRDWDSAVKGMDEAIDFISSRCGVYRPEVLPYANMLPVLASMAMSVDVGERSELLESWFWSTVFSGAIDAAANTRLVNHYRALTEGVPGSIDIGRVNIDLTRNTKFSNKSLHRAMCCFIASQEVGFDVFRERGVAFDDIETMSVYSVRDLESNPEYSSDSIVNTLIGPSFIARSYGDAALLHKRAAFEDKGISEVVDRQVNSESSSFHPDVFESRVARLAGFLNEKRLGSASFFVSEVGEDEGSI